MSVEYKHFGIINDNEHRYFLLLEEVISSIDNDATVVFIHNPEKYLVRISTSERIYINPIISLINNIFSMVNIHLTWSKSMKSGNISFFFPIFAGNN